ncbi:hypothetical protein QJU96_09895 [Pasteurella skyensis]|uniref:Uncharacterized protein n=1 Tax=Phocoenobacter skyensis TaxID=97481 RepID=A0AAJ6NFH8_9PAST|nr:hypothetical protein [Pasteurella skyensis]MDP8171593.1 hypothetical protein [Pasteurella skyensis]MDP8175839.1 hypothetical protein [Pasteurella skyensis]
MKKIEENRILKAFPKYLEKDVLLVCDKIPKTVKYNISNDKLREYVHSCYYKISFDNEILHLPSRIYFNEANDDNLTKQQKQILYCIYTRHHNGFVREKYLKKIEVIQIWQIPFVIQLLGEYVIELFPIIENKINKNNFFLFKKFIAENEFYFYQTECRIASYWNEYYRRTYPKLKEYIGYKIKEKLKTNT